MTAQPVEAFGHEPGRIRDQLPEQYRAAFPADYRRALSEAAADVWRFAGVERMLAEWRVRAAAYADPSFEAQRAEAADPNAATVSLEDVIARYTASG